ncbi:MAG TPA: Type 1 glutamine amidotransferase-like domain-containing protein [Candidatus Paceibacterota bacterium]
MRLYLSSYRLGNKPEKLTALFGEGRRVGIILNARDNAMPEFRGESLIKQTAILKGIGLEGQEIDLRNFKNAEAIRAELLKYNGLWIPGGNSFLLRRAMYDSGFDKVISEILKNSDFVYAGYSAAAVILGKTMRGIELVDNPNAVKEIYGTEPIWEGLNILPYTIVPHYKSNHPESADVEKEVAFYDKEKMPYKTLRDGEAVVINGESEEIVG